ncbi:MULTISPECIES: hypothetical protein [Hymenobacter]|uniref:Uncharacterized protein n=1 Tax=Hymenobacter psychrotolerans DSM 18569 TaxID=1121959 RepID=A0A1M6ZPL0_9BACT|nr:MULTISPECIES: hypothetical protein [Hymenobacter]QNE42099.1 hypothetical protein F1C16_20975 [Hymenobacter sp. NBH84]SHL32329.1 hypothetical protein SAMN02746009_02536 [Hymenobacter psychrotolerans DSM 18569]
MTNTSPTQLFQELLALLRATRTTEATVRQRLRPFTTRTRPIPSRLGRTYLLVEAPFFRVTATFEGPAQELYQVILRLTPAAYAEIKAYARTLPATEDGARWRGRWLGMLPRLDVAPAVGSEAGLRAYFLGLFPQRKIVVLTRQAR